MAAISCPGAWVHHPGGKLITFVQKICLEYRMVTYIDRIYYWTVELPRLPKIWILEFGIPEMFRRKAKSYRLAERVIHWDVDCTFEMQKICVVFVLPRVRDMVQTPTKLENILILRDTEWNGYWKICLYQRKCKISSARHYDYMQPVLDTKVWVAMVPCFRFI